MEQLSLIARKYGEYTLIVIAAFVIALEVLLRLDDSIAPETATWFLVMAVILVVLPLLGHRRFPFASPALFWLLVAALSIVDGGVVPHVYGLELVGMYAAFLLGNLRDTLQLRIGFIIMLGGLFTIFYNDPNRTPSEFIFIPIIFIIAWLVGYAMRERAERTEAAETRAAIAEHEREVAARIAVAEERTRIARELHDVVAHAVSVMVLQVGAVRHRLPDELRDDREALDGVERAGRTALTEMRRLLGAMRSDADSPELAPQPGLDSLDPLLKDIERAGLPVRLHIEGDPHPLPRAIDLSAYRIVQEGLTNALKHANAGRADVTINYGPADLRIEVRDDGAGASAGEGSGLGLVGIGERVKIFGGEINAGPAPDGGFVLSTRLPLGGDTR